MTRPSDLLTRPQLPRVFSPEEQEQKHFFYQRMSPRRRRFVDRIGYENWDPFAPPKEPMDMRTDSGHRTVAQLVEEFLRATPKSRRNDDYMRGAKECAMGIVSQQEKYMGMLDFCAWYHKLLQKERTPE